MGKLAVTSADKPSATGTGDAASRVQNNFGLIDSETDFLGYQTLFTWDTARRLPTAVTRAAGSPESQTVNTQWHPTFRLPTLITEAGRTTAYTYDTLGNRLSETITDTTPGPTNGVARTTGWTYNAQGLVATETAPNGGVSRFTYDAVGNLTSSANALRHTTTFVYGTVSGGSFGRITQVTAPTGLVTNFAYDPRGRVLTVNRGGEVTSYGYIPSGQIGTVTLPSGHQITYGYDAAQRLNAWADNRGARGTYTLDNMGNRTVEEVRDTLGNLVWRNARSINALNRVQNETTGANLTTSYGYDQNGSLQSEANGLNQGTQYGLDGLRRVKTLTNAVNATASLQYNALDAVTGATDFKGVATGFARDALGNATQEATADAGTRSNQYDSLGLPSQLVDALGQATNIQRDLLGRPKLITWADGKTATLGYDLTGTAYNTADAPNASKGYLSQIVDRAGTTRYVRNIQGRVARITTIMAGVSTKAVTTTYVVSGGGTGEVDTITYGNGSRLKHLYNGAGQIVQLNWNEQPLVQNITWNALGLPTSWQWANTPTVVLPPILGLRTYDTAGRVTATEFSSYQYDPAGRITTLSQELWKPANSNPASTLMTTTVATWTAGYDPEGRLLTLNTTPGLAPQVGPERTTYTYDANGNRLSSVQTIGTGTATQTITRNYNLAPGTNRLTGFTQLTQTPSGQSTTTVNYTLNANGDLTDDGLRRYTYDPDNRLASVATGSLDTSPTTRYAHNALGQRVFKTELLYSPVQGDEADPGFFRTLLNFFSQLWAPATVAAEKLGWPYLYDSNGNLLGEYGTGGPNSNGPSEFVYLPTPNGPMPIMALIKGSRFAVHTDHLNTPRKLTRVASQSQLVVWQWPYSAFGDAPPTLGADRHVNPLTTPNAGTTTIAKVEFNLRYPGQHFDKESNLSYNYFRSYRSQDGRYTQADPIGLEGGWNRFGYVGGNALGFTDPEGLRQGGGSARQRRTDRREQARDAQAEVQRLQEFFQRKAQQDAWMQNFTRRNDEWSNYGDGFSALTGSGAAARHPGVPNSFEWWIDPGRRNSGEPYVPGLPDPGANRSTTGCERGAFK